MSAIQQSKSLNTIIMKLSEKTKIGILAILALILVYFGINYLKGINLLKKPNIYHVSFEEVHNVNKASPVLIDGYKVGIVKDMIFDFKKGRGITLVLDLVSDMKVEKGTSVAIKQTALSGAEVHLSRPEQGGQGYHSVGDTLLASPGSGDILAMTNNKIMPAIVNLLPKADSLLSSLTRLANSSEFSTILLSLELSAKELNKSMAQINQVVRRDFDPMMANLNETAGNIKQVSETLSKVDMDRIHQTLSDLSAMTHELKRAVAQLEKTDNTAGLLLNDDKLYKRIDSLANSADMLMKDIRENPKRYVHFSIF
ncbi:MlaD family protein [Porphyromonas crevioricanis]|nr:MlaD family protein [Porphyromonas crevioricanis]GAD07801.1 Mce4/Rv3499c/MTV023.06c protein [Porphyromonas crevioricanis JCM 13913]